MRAALPGVIFAGQLGARFAREPEWVPMFPHASDLVAPLDELVDETVTKLIVRHPELTLPELAEAVREVAGERSQVTFSGMRIVELSAPGVHKAAGGGVGGASCSARDPADLLAFGDAPNDLEMLRSAAWGVAMGNAHPDVVAVADEQTASNDDDGVAVVLERLAPRILRPMHVTLPDGTRARRPRRRHRPRRRAAIGPRLASATAAVKVDGKLQDLRLPVPDGATFAVVRVGDEDAPAGAAALDGARAGRGRAPRVPGREDHDRPADRQRLLLRLPVRGAHHRGRPGAARERDAPHPEDASTRSRAAR